MDDMTWIKNQLASDQDTSGSVADVCTLGPVRPARVRSLHKFQASVVEGKR